MPNFAITSQPSLSSRGLRRAGGLGGSNKFLYTYGKEFYKEIRRVHFPCAFPRKWDIGWEVDDGESLVVEENLSVKTQSPSNTLPTP